jgi:biotin operon repressor
MDHSRWSVRRLLTEKLPTPVWLVPDLIPEGLTLLVGAPKVGKSWLALNLALAWGTGGVALGSRQVSLRPVLYLALEDTPPRLKGRLESLKAPEDTNLDFILRRDWGERGTAATDRIQRELDAKPEIRVVVVDTLERIRLGGGGGDSSYSLDVAELDRLARLAEQGVSIIALHHDRKASGADILDRVSGTKGVTGTADTIILLDKDRTNSMGTLIVTGRDVEDQRIALEFDGAVGSWVELGEAWQYQRNSNKQKVIDAILSAGSPLCPSLIAAETGLSRDTAKHLAARLEKEGVLTVVGRGSYTVAGAPSLAVIKGGADR